MDGLSELFDLFFVFGVVSGRRGLVRRWLFSQAIEQLRRTLLAASKVERVELDRFEQPAALMFGLDSSVLLGKQREGLLRGVRGQTPIT